MKQLYHYSNRCRRTSRQVSGDGPIWYNASSRSEQPFALPNILRMRKAGRWDVANQHDTIHRSKPLPLPVHRRKASAVQQPVDAMQTALAWHGLFDAGCRLLLQLAQKCPDPPLAVNQLSATAGQSIGGGEAHRSCTQRRPLRCVLQPSEGVGGALPPHGGGSGAGGRRLGR